MTARTQWILDNDAQETLGVEKIVEALPRRSPADRGRALLIGL